jgi:ubiquinone/menaquinone biosynthesis C-methylase UbiE
MRATMRERTFRSKLVAGVFAQSPVKRVLDLGTGTGSLALELAKAAPRAHITGLDPDPSALARATAKAGPGCPIDWVKGQASALPFPDRGFDAVTCSLVLHHLDTPGKLLALGECLRVLEPGGMLHIADWGRASDPLMWMAFLSIRLLDGFARTSAHAAGALPRLIQTAGFSRVRVTERLRTCWGTLELISAQAPAAAGSL